MPKVMNSKEEIIIGVFYPYDQNIAEGLIEYRLSITAYFNGIRTNVKEVK
jgi:hypothetical protein